MGKNPLHDSDYSCLKCAREIKHSEVFVTVHWWVGYISQNGEKKTLTEQIIYHYCYPCGRKLDFQNMKTFQLDEPRFKLEGALNIEHPRQISECEECGRKILEGVPYASIRVILEFKVDNSSEELGLLYQKDFCNECAPQVDLDNIFILETDTPADLIAITQQMEKQRNK